MHKREKERKNKNKKEEEENKMKYKTLIEKNSEPILTEGRLTPPPPPTTHPRFASTTLLPPFPATAYPTDKGAFTLAKKIAGSVKKTHAQRIQLKHQKHGTKTCE